MTQVKVGQVWKDKDKRRNTVIEIIDTFTSDDWDLMALGLVTGTEEERVYRVDRLVKRWELVEEKPEPVVPCDAPKPKAIIPGSTKEELEEARVELKAAASKNWQLKAVCQENDDYKVRFTKRIAEVYGMPLCPCHKKPLVFTEGH